MANSGLAKTGNYQKLQTGKILYPFAGSSPWTSLGVHKKLGQNESPEEASVLMQAWGKGTAAVLKA